ncbi:hydantoinase B/oxoprolinase family protein [Nitrospirillum sp. BR 11828]|uniref:hydantoinase B/oxoprolinase family protein n=1 Tax=Nitrospirillum sp. BR 11828 TaxID=3104325 RepID=UPI002ACA584D|nr:hydantoinase B/oxoprolinase family protein [Nitrospirillum sp. BR 11828]MDZ5650626.1 hydantoinase B/oxoprolinase family protein [Nitrospirillum sp. BR 11828]
MASGHPEAGGSGWEFWVDRGGTFTDIVARRPDGRLLTAKLLSENPEQYQDAAVAGIRSLLAAHADFPATIDAVKIGTTVATNALLERKGEPLVLAITRGHADALRIGYQARPRLFDRHIRLADSLYTRVVEVAERVDADGAVLTPLDEAATRRDLQAAYDAGYRAVAVVLMHGYRFDAHEGRVAAIARDIGYTQVSVSHETSRLIKLVRRGDTTVVDAYLSPVLRRYVDQVSGALQDGGAAEGDGAEGNGARLLFMQSNGGLVNARAFQGRDAVLSGPAGGIVGMVATAVEAGFDKVIGFDMGGTSTDVSHYAGTYERTYETMVAGVRLCAPMMNIHTVAAGGGSVCSFDGSRFRVGPESAGAVPGPVCYRRGGPLAVTDCNLMLGKIQPAFFPQVFGVGADQPLDLAAVEARFQALAAEVQAATGEERTPHQLAEGFITIAVEKMAKAIKEISVQRGYDVAQYTLACFGGAGGQHACLVADALGMTRVMIHPFAGVLSAYGMGLADLRVIRDRTIEQPLSPDLDLSTPAQALAREARADLAAQDVPVADVEVELTARLKYAGTDTGLTVPFGDAGALADAFAEAHRRRFGFVAPGKTVVVEALAAEAIGHPGRGRIAAPPVAADGDLAPLATVRTYMAGAEADTPVYDRAHLAPGNQVDGPALIREATATTVIEPGWRARVDDHANLILERVVALAPRTAIGTTVDPVMLEVFNNLFMAVAEQMGYALQNTAYSVNIKERLDFSCALFDRGGGLIANAPHMPVHLGSMGDSVRAIVEARSRDGRGLRPGDVYMLNAPYNGGTHLPDVTVVMPVFDADGRLLVFVAARGHQGDIGGITPGSMPPNSRTVEDEGVLIDNFLLVEGGRFREEETRALLAGGRYPARNPDQNIGDLRAQVAACAKGAEEMAAMVAQFGRDVVEAYMAHMQDNAEEAVRRVIGVLKDGTFRYEMDNGAVIQVAVTVDRQARQAVVDFTGTSAQLETNFNAPLSVCRAAVLYVFRTLVDDEIPMNEGCLKPIVLKVPAGCLLNPAYPAAVVAGNVETSQVVVDALYGALGVMAGAQGTMNNFTFGDDARQYYETICGGSGAGADFDGTSAVQTHMTNSRLTDPEVMEVRYPVLVERFAIRRGSGGAGRHRGGDGVERLIRFRAPMTAAILSNRRRVPPFGLEGGGSGAPGVTEVHRADGTVSVLAATDTVAMNPGDAILVKTPGGGGFGGGYGKTGEGDA